MLRRFILSFLIMSSFFSANNLIAVNVGDRVPDPTRYSWWSNRKFTPKDRAGKFVVIFLFQYRGDFADYSGEDDTTRVVVGWGNQDEKLGGGWRTVAPDHFPKSISKNVFVTTSSGIFSDFNIKSSKLDNPEAFVLDPDNTVVWSGTIKISDYEVPDALSIVAPFIKQYTNPLLKDHLDAVKRLREFQPALNQFLDSKRLYKYIKNLTRGNKTRDDAERIMSEIENYIKTQIKKAKDLEKSGNAFDAYLILSSLQTAFSSNKDVKKTRSDYKRLKKEPAVKAGRAAWEYWKKYDKEIRNLVHTPHPQKKTVLNALETISKYKDKFPDSHVPADLNKLIYQLNASIGNYVSVDSDNQYLKDLTGKLIIADRSDYDPRKLKSMKYILVYFSAHWCPPCKVFTPKLVKYYNSHGGGKDFELIFISADTSEQEMFNYMNVMSMPWPAVKYDLRKQVNAYGLASNGIPHLVLLDATGEVLSEGQSNVFDDLTERLPSQ